METLMTSLLEAGFAQLFVYIAKMGGLAAATVMLIEFATRSKWVPWLTQETSDRAKRIVAVAVAAAQAVGLSYTYDGAAERLVIDGFSAARLAAIAAAILSQAGLQHLIFIASRRLGLLRR